MVVAPEILRWAIERSGRDAEDLKRRFPKLKDWLNRKAQPTLRQLQDFASATYTPFGCFFLDTPPEERLLIPDFRTRRPAALRKPSGNLLDTLYLCQQRQAWYEDFVLEEGLDPVPVVGSLRRMTPIEDAARAIREAIHFDLEARRQYSTWTEALRRFIEAVEEIGVLVMVSGVVGSNTHRRLDPEEFRGFALSDPRAPLIFINGADTKAAQMFTLAHELAHLALGQSALSDAEASIFPDEETERWSNQVAAEVLVPLATLRDELRPAEPWQSATTRLARRFKVSSLVILRRLFEVGAFPSEQQFWRAYREERERVRELAGGGEGGDFYRTLGARASKRFEHALVVSALSGRTTLTEAMRLLGFKRMTVFDGLARRLGFSY
jgi:Zn-dependent peptidase ImmA (M78 family)